MKRLFSILLSLALCMIAAGCSNTGGQTSSQPANSSLESSGAVQTPPSSQTEPSGSQSESSQPEEPASSSPPETPSSSDGSELPEEPSSAVSEPVSAQPSDGSAFDPGTGTVQLNSGETMPVLGIGTFRLSQEQAENSVYWALRDGYRLIDTARIYGNEVGVGRGIRRAISEGFVTREEIFVTTKMWTADYHDGPAAIAAAHGKTSAQVILRWHLQAGNIAIPGSGNEAHIQENYEIFDFSLSDEEMARMASLNKDQRFAGY